jgi:hypothetical protein
MQPHRQDRLTDGDGRLPSRLAHARSMNGLQASCQRRAHVIDALTDAVSVFAARSGGVQHRDGGVIAVSDLERGGVFGLNVVQALSERWGLEPVGAGGTRVGA